MLARWPRLRRLLRWTGATFLLIVALLVGVYLLRDRLLARPLANLVAEQMSAALGGKFTLERIEGNYFSELVVVGLRTERAPPENPLRRIDIDRASVRFSLRRLLDDPVGAIEAIEASGLVLELDLDQPTEPSEEPFDLEQWLPRRFPTIALDGSVRVRAGSRDYSIGAIDVRGGGETLDLRLETIDIAGELQSPLLRLDITQPEFGTFVARSNDLFGGVVPREISVQVIGELVADAKLELAGGSIAATFTEEQASATIRKVDLAKLPAELLSRIPADIQLPQSGQVSFDVRLDRPLDPNPKIVASAELLFLRWDDWRATRITANGEWHDGVAMLRKLDAAIDGGSVEARGIELRPDLALPLVRLDSIEAELPDLRTPLRRLGIVQNLPDAPIAFTMRAHRATGEPVKIDALRLEVGESHVEATGEFTLPADTTDWEATPLVLTLDAVLDAQSLPPGEASIEGRVTVSGRVAGTIGAPRARLDIEGSGLSIDGQRIETLEAKGELEWPRVALESLRFVAAPGSLSLRGSADLEQRLLTEASYTIDISDLAELAKLIPGAPPMKGTIRGKGTIVRASLDGEREGDADVICDGLEIDGVVIDTATIKAALRGDTIDLTEFAARAPTWSVAGSAEAQVSFKTGVVAAKVKTLKAEAGGRSAELRAPLRLDWDGNTATIRDLDAMLLGGRVLGSATYGDTFAVTLEGSGLDMAEAHADAGGRIGFRLDARGTIAAPRWELSVLSDGLTVQQRRAKVDVRVRQDDRGIHIESLQVDGVPDLDLDGSGFVPIEVGAEGVRRLPGVPDLHLSIDVTPGDLAPYLPAVVSFTRTTREATLKENLLAGNLTVNDLRWTEAPEDFIAGKTVIALNGDAQGVELRIDGSNLGPLLVDAKLRSEAGIDWKDPKALIERIRSAPIAGRASITIPDLSPLARLPDSPIAHGEGSGKIDLVVAGSLPKPEITATIDMQSPRLRLEGGLPALQDVVIRVKVTPRGMTIEKFDALLGYSPLALQGSIMLVGGKPVLDLRATGTNVLLAQTPYLRLRADLDIALKGPVEALATTGSVVLTNVLWSEPLRLLDNGGATAADERLHLFSIRDEPLKNMTFDVSIKANETIRLDNNVVRGRLSTDLRLLGTGGVPHLEGRVDFRKLRLNFPITRERLDITRGSLVFPHDDPFRPAVSISAEARKLGHDLAVEITGKVPNVDVLITSIPPLPRDEALVLLTTGTTKERLAQSGETTAGIYVGRTILDAVMGPSDPDKESLLDRFEFESGREVSGAGDPTMEARFRITRRIYVTAERDRWDDYNGGFLLRLRFR